MMTTQHKILEKKCETQHEKYYNGNHVVFVTSLVDTVQSHFDLNR